MHLSRNIDQPFGLEPSIERDLAGRVIVLFGHFADFFIDIYAGQRAVCGIEATSLYCLRACQSPFRVGRARQQMATTMTMGRRQPCLGHST